ncbi:hypothetical protein FM114_11055 [Luteococcus japonicus LSP_Lj1]|uniref:Uncharacterized protein n=1 Tax=Luteococcus japonicus LSP_Lj1 TaxID=1255658 RepID=A0A1R4K306_9ACTN|nr:hypothetical protein FM114_11055 [Luteococcus japonicus LSP_Lj1]
MLHGRQVDLCRDASIGKWGRPPLDPPRSVLSRWLLLRRSAPTELRGIGPGLWLFGAHRIPLRRIS